MPIAGDMSPWTWQIWPLSRNASMGLLWWHRLCGKWNFCDVANQGITETWRIFHVQTLIRIASRWGSFQLGPGGGKSDETINQQNTVAELVTSRPWKDTYPSIFLESFTSGRISPAYDVRLTSGKKHCVFKEEDYKKHEGPNWARWYWGMKNIEKMEHSRFFGW